MAPEFRDAAAEYEYRLAEVKAGIFWPRWLLDYLQQRTEKERQADATARLR